MSDYTTVTLEDLVGDRFLSGVGYYDWNPNPSDYDGVTFNFILDGMLYAVVEDANDGYRSSLRDVFVTGHIGQVSNTFSPVAVVCEMDKVHDILHILDKVTGESIIRIGTEEYDSYYPCFINNYNPEAMSVNKFVEERTVVTTNVDWLVENMRQHGGFATFPKVIDAVLKEIYACPEVREIEIGDDRIRISIQFDGLFEAAEMESLDINSVTRVNALGVLLSVMNSIGEDTAKILEYFIHNSKIYPGGKGDASIIIRKKTHHE